MAQSYGYSPVEPEGWGYVPSPTTTTPVNTDWLQSEAVQYSAVTGEDPDVIHQEMEDTGPYAPLDRAYQTVLDSKAKTLENLASQAASYGDQVATEVLLAARKEVGEESWLKKTMDSERFAAVSTEAAINLVAEDSDKRYKSEQAALDSAEYHAKLRGHALVVKHALADLQKGYSDSSGTVGKVWNTAAGFIPFSSAVDMTQTAIAARVGGKFDLDTPSAMMYTLQGYLAGLQDPDQVVAAVKAIADAGPFLTDAARADFVGRIMEDLSGQDVAMAVGFTAFDVADAGALAKLAAKAVKQGQLGRVTAKLNPKKASELVESDLIRGTKKSDLTPEQQASTAMSVLDAPGLSKEQVTGLSGNIQEKLLQGQRDTWKKLTEALPAGARTPQEVANGRAAIAAQYDPAVRRDIHSVELGETTQNSTMVTTNTMRSDGSLFATREEAQAVILRHELTDAEVVPVHELPVRAANDFDKPSIGSPEEALLAELLKKTGAGAELVAKVNKQFLDTGESVILSPGMSTTHGEKLAFTYRKLMDMLGFEGENLHLVTMAERSANNWTVKKDFDGSEGIFSKKRGDRNFHIIAISDKLLEGNKGERTRVRRLQLYVHEFSHFFKQVVFDSDTRFSKQWPTIERALLAQRENAADVEDYYVRLRQAGTSHTILDLVNGGLKPLNKKSRELFMRWSSIIDEQWAENFSKALFGNEDTSSVIGTYFHNLIASMKQMYLAIAKHLGFSTEEAVPEIQKFLVDFLDDIRKNGPVQGRLEQAIAKADEVEEIIIPSVVDESVPLGTDELDFTAKKEILAVEEERGYPETISSDPAKVMHATAREEVAAPSMSGYVIRQKLRAAHQTGSIGSFDPDDIASMPLVAADPQHAASTLAVQERMIAVHAEDKIKSAFKEHLAEGWNPLNSSSRAKVSQVLEEGNIYENLDGTVGREFSAVELLERDLSEKEQVAYFRSRQVAAMTHAMEDAEMSRLLQASGYVNLRVGVIIEGEHRVLRTPAKLAQPSEGSVIWDARTNSPITFTAERMKEWPDGTEVIRLHQPHKIGRDSYSLVLIDEKSASRTAITTVLPKKAGQYGLHYTDEYFISRVQSKVKLDGIVVDATKSIFRTSSTKTEADQYVRDLNSALSYLKAVKAGEIEARDTEEMVGSLVGGHTDVPKLIKDFDLGLYEGVSFEYKYSDTKLGYLNSKLEQTLADDHGRAALPVSNKKNTLDPIRALEAEITNVARVSSIGAWRQNIIQRWMNQFGGSSSDPIGAFFKITGSDFGSGKEGLFAKRTYNYVRQQLGLQTKEEKVYAGWSKLATEYYPIGDKTLPWATTTIGQQIRNSSWLNFIRATNFNLVLGVFNPAQLLVQGSGMTTAAIIHPLHGLAAAKTFPLLRLALMSDNPAVWKVLGQFHKWSELGLRSADEIGQLVQSIRRTGLIDNLRSTSLHNAEDGRLGVVTGLGGKFLASGRFFFNRGEELSRVISFDIARREWIGNNPGLPWNTDQALKDIMVRQDNYTQNMTKANQAAWQRGALAIPIQFIRYNVNLASNILSSGAEGIAKLSGKPAKYRGLTATESAKVMAGHLLLYGAAGYGAVGMLDEILGKESESMDVETKNYLAQGLLSGLFSAMTEDDTGKASHVAIGSRLSSFNFYTELAQSVMHPENHSFLDVIAGPTGSTIGRGIEAVANIRKLWDVEVYKTPEAILEGAWELARSEITSLRNVTKAYLVYENQGIMRSKKGDPVARLDPVETFALAVGLQPTQAVDVSMMLQDKHNRDVVFDDIAAAMHKVQRDAMYAISRGDVAEYENKRKALALLVPKNAADWFEVARRMKDYQYPYDTQMQGLLADYLTRSYNPERSTPFTVTSEPGGRIGPR